VLMMVHCPAAHGFSVAPTPAAGATLFYATTARAKHHRRDPGCSSATATTSALASLAASSTPSQLLNVAIDRPLPLVSDLLFGNGGDGGIVTTALTSGRAAGATQKFRLDIIKLLRTMLSSKSLLSIVAIMAALLLSFMLVSESENKSSVLASFTRKVREKLFSSPSLQQEPIQQETVQNYGNAAFAQRDVEQDEGEISMLDDAPATIPMPFDEMDENEGWGVCRLRSKRRYKEGTSFFRLDFDLPDSRYVLPLDLGEAVTVCCLNSRNEAVKADFYPFQLGQDAEPGRFSLLVPDPSLTYPSNAIGDDSEEDSRRWNDVRQAKFVQAVLQYDMHVGDEIALKPSGVSQLLCYQGPPSVTDITYVAYGTGIVPVLDQLRAVLSGDESSAETLTVVWINESPNDFGDIATVLENDYYDVFSDKLAVSCVVMSDDEEDMNENDDIQRAIASFRPGSMGVVAGPSEFTEKTLAFLKEKGFPKDCICVM
jgi:hypothetical protein